MYAKERVTPILGKLIENIMAERPDDPAAYVVQYLTRNDGLAAAASHWDSLTRQLADSRKQLPPAAAGGGSSADANIGIPMTTLKAISAALDPYMAQERVVQEACSLLRCDRASIFLLDVEANELVLHVAKGADDIRIPRTAGIAGQVNESGQTVTINDPYKDPRFNQATDKATGYTTTSILCVPIKDADGNTIGVLQAINKLEGGFTEADASLAERLSVAAGITLKNAEEHEHLRVSEQKTRSLVEVVKAVSSNMGLNSVIFTITQKCPKLVECEAATMYLIDMKRGQLWSIATDTGKEFRVPLKGTIAGYVSDTGKVVNIPDCYADTSDVRPTWSGHDFDQKTNFRTRNMLVLPIMIGGWNDFEPFNKEVVGVLQLINKTTKADSGFSEADEEILDSFLGIVATIVKSSFVFDKLGHEAVSEAAAVFNQGPAHLARRPSASQGQLMETFREMEGVAEEDEEEDEEEEQQADQVEQESAR
jgi:GAF domain-containing protein